MNTHSDNKRLRELFPQLKTQIKGNPLVYLDNAASTLKHKDVIAAINDHYSFHAANIHRGVHTLSEEGTKEFEQTRDELQAFIGANEREEIILTSGTTESINLVAHSYGREFFRPGDQILLTTMEHHSNIVPWQLVAEACGAHIVEVPIDDKGEILKDDYLDLLKSGGEKVKMIATAHISNTLGTINPIEELIQLAREHTPQAKFLVDAAQSAAHLPIDVQKLDCDFLAFSAHKMYGPTGVGVLYGKRQLLEQMPPYQGGGDMIDQVRFEKTTYNDIPHKFEAGTPHIAGVIAFKESLRFLKREGLKELSTYQSELLSYATERLRSIQGLTIHGPDQLERKSAVISFSIEGAHPQDLGTLLDQQGIAVRTGHHCTQPLMQRLGVTATTRASFAPYNTKTEIDGLYYGLIKACELL